MRRVDLVNWAHWTSPKISVPSGFLTRSSFIISVLPKGRSFTTNSGTEAAILPRGRSFIANSGTYVAVLLGMNRCGSFQLLSALPLSLASRTNLKGSEKIPGAPAWRWEWSWLIGPSWLHRNSPQGLNISSIRVFDQIRVPEIPITLRPHNIYVVVFNYCISYKFFSNNEVTKCCKCWMWFGSFAYN